MKYPKKQEWIIWQTIKLRKILTIVEIKIENI